MNSAFESQLYNSGFSRFFLSVFLQAVDVLYDSIILFSKMCNLYSVFVFRFCGFDTSRIDDCGIRCSIRLYAKVFEIDALISIADLRKNE